MSQDDPKDGVSLIAAERARQINVKGWTAEHDDGHDRGELAKAGAFYAAGPDVCPITGSALMDLWPKEWGDPTTFEVGGFTRAGRIRELTIAGALIAAEIDRLMRAEKRSGGGR